MNLMMTLLCSSNLFRVFYKILVNLFSFFFSTLFHLPDRDNREELGKENIEQYEKGEAARQYRPFHPGRCVRYRFGRSKSLMC